MIFVFCFILIIFYLRAFCTRNAATIPIVVGKLAAQTPSFLSVFSSILDATIKGGAHYKID
jgi:hypothetical protein